MIVAVIHEQKPAIKTRRWHVTECKCGWGSPLCSTPEQANRLLAEHMRDAVKPVRPANPATITVA